VGFFGKEITDSTIPEDFRNMKIHQAWEITYKSEEVFNSTKPEKIEKTEKAKNIPEEIRY